MKAITTALTLVITLAALNSNAFCMKRYQAAAGRDNVKTAFRLGEIQGMNNTASQTQAVSKKR